MLTSIASVCAEPPGCWIVAEYVSLKKDQAVRPQGSMAPSAGSAEFAVPLTYSSGAQALATVPWLPSCLSDLLRTYLRCTKYQ